MKKGFILSLITFAVTFSSCEKYLEVDTYDRVPDNNTIFDKGSAEAAVRGAYRGLASLNYSGGFQNTILQSGGDIRSLNNAQTDLNVVNYDLRSDIPFLSTYWGNFYNTINRANHVIEKVPQIEDVNLTDALQNQLVGEAHFIRAVSYFDLVRVYGGVQLFLKPTVVATDKLGLKRSTAAEVYTQILSDLSKAESLLPNTVVRNRATKFTVYALRARVNLYQNKFEDAEADANKVLANTSYRLITPFAPAAGTSESILELAYSINDINGAFGLWNTSNRSLDLKPALQTLLNDPNVGGGRKLYISVKTGSNFNNPLFPTNTSSGYLIRTAEVYLIRAEARLKKANSDLTGALADLNAVRTRAAVPAIAGTPTKEELILAVENERRVEFALEPHRWFDLTRTGRAPAVLGLNNSDRYIFPIPAGEILADPALTQNPGYGN